MVPQRLDAPTRILLSGFLVASLLLAGAAGVTSAQSSSVSFATTNGTVTVDPGPSATVRGTSNYEAGTTLTVRLRTTGDTDPRKLATQTVTVDEDGAFSTSFNLSAYEAGDTFSVTARHDDSQVATAEVVVDGAAQDSEQSPSNQSLPGFGVGTAALALGSALGIARLRQVF